MAHEETDSDREYSRLMDRVREIDAELMYDLDKCVGRRLMEAEDAGPEFAALAR